MEIGLVSGKCASGHAALLVLPMAWRSRRRCADLRSALLPEDAGLYPRHPSPASGHPSGRCRERLSLLDALKAARRARHPMPLGAEVVPHVDDVGLGVIDNQDVQPIRCGSLLGRRGDPGPQPSACAAGRSGAHLCAPPQNLPGEEHRGVPPPLPRHADAPRTARASRLSRAEALPMLSAARCRAE